MRLPTWKTALSIGCLVVGLVLLALPEKQVVPALGCFFLFLYLSD